MNGGKPRVSIGLPVFNGEKYLEQAIDSILAQTYSNFEVIVSDNSSTDRTQEICQEYAARDPRVRYSRNDRNLGAAPNFNRVFRLSSSEYFKWADHDDVLAPEFLSRCIEVLDRNPAVILCIPRSRIIDKDGRFLGEHEYEFDAGSMKPHVRFRNVVLNQDTGWQLFGLIRAEALEKTGLHGSYPGSDLVLLAELALYGQFSEIPEYLFFPRYHPEQATRRIPIERNRVLLYDTALREKILLPKWLYLYGYLTAIKHAPLTKFERSYCCLQMGRWMLKPDHFRAMGKDVVVACTQLMTRAVRKPHGAPENSA